MLLLCNYEISVQPVLCLGRAQEGGGEGRIIGNGGGGVGGEGLGGGGGGGGVKGVGGRVEGGV